MKIALLLFLLGIFSTSVFAQSVSLREFQDGTKKLNNISLPKEPNGEIVAAKTKDFSFSINPYLWTMGIGGTVGLPSFKNGFPATIDFDKSFSDLAGNLKFAFMVAGRLKYKKVSLLYDLAYANLKDFDATVPDGYGFVSADPSFKMMITDLALAYSIGTGNKNIRLDVYGGTRFWSFDADVTFEQADGTLVMKSGKDSWVDPVFGVQADFVLSKDWFSYVKTDFGGLGVNSDWTYMLFGGFGYKFSPNWNSTLGLKYLGVNYEKDNSIWELNAIGLLLSVGYAY